MDLELKNHTALIDIARNAGLGVLTYEEQAENWRLAIARVRKIVERWGIDFQPLHGAQYRDRRRYGSLAVKQCRANQADNQQLRAPRPGSGIPGGQQRQQRDDAAFTPVVGPQYQEGIFR